MFPKMLLKRFADENKFFHAYDRVRRVYREHHISSSCVESNFYRYIGADGVIHDETEIFLRSIESDVCPIINKLEKKEGISPTEQRELAEFIVYQRMRVPKFKKIFLSNACQESTSYVNDPNSGKELYLTTLIAPNLKSIPVHNKIVDLWVRYNWLFLHTTKSDEFVITDNPCITKEPDRYFEYYEADVNSTGGKVAIPLSSSFVLLITEHGSLIEHRELPKNIYKEINDDLVNQSERFIFSKNKKVLRRFVNNNGL